MTAASESVAGLQVSTLLLLRFPETTTLRDGNLLWARSAARLKEALLWKLSPRVLKNDDRSSGAALLRPCLLSLKPLLPRFPSGQNFCALFRSRHGWMFQVPRRTTCSFCDLFVQETQC